jgi:uncharacterized protein YciI
VPDSYAAYYEPGPNWLRGKSLKEQPLKTHVEYLVSLHERGKLSMGGPLADGSGGLVIFVAEDLEEVERMVLSDPAIEDGILIATVKKWSRIV